MSQHMELRTIFGDSIWANQNDDGSFSINLSEQLEIAPEHVLFFGQHFCLWESPTDCAPQQEAICFGANSQKFQIQKFRGHSGQFALHQLY